MRWITEKAMDGWRWIGQKASRDNDKLKHHLLLAYGASQELRKTKTSTFF